MSTVRLKTDLLEARQLIGDAAATMAVCEWVVSLGYPWLLGDATRPRLLAPEGGKPGDPGIYIEPQWGELVIKDGERSQHAAYSDWIVKGTDGKAHVVKDVYFKAKYEVVDA